MTNLHNGAMAAVLGLCAETIDEICSAVSKRSEQLYVDIANFNGHDQTVISGTSDGVKEASLLLKDKGAKLTRIFNRKGVRSGRFSGQCQANARFLRRSYVSLSDKLDTF